MKPEIMSYDSGIYELWSEIKRYVYAFLTRKGETFSREYVVFKGSNWKYIAAIEQARNTNLGQRPHDI